MNIIGISAYYHDSAAALVVDGVITAAAQEERFTRKKHDPSFPQQAIQYCLDEANISLEEVDISFFMTNLSSSLKDCWKRTYPTHQRGFVHSYQLCQCGYKKSYF